MLAIIVTSVGYNSVNAIASEVCKARGATYHEVPLLFPLDSSGEVLTPEAMVMLVSYSQTAYIGAKKGLVH